MPGLDPIPRFTFAGDPEQVRRFASALITSADELSRKAGLVARAAQAVTRSWNSVPSSARAIGRLDALTDLLRSQSLRCRTASGPLGQYATALAAAQQAVSRANVAIDRYNDELAHGRVPGPLEQIPINAARSAAADLHAADARCVSALHELASGEGRGPAAVIQRVHVADRAAGDDATVLAGALRAARAQQPPDLVTLEEGLRALGRMAVSDPHGAARVVDVLGPATVAALPHLGHGHPGWGEADLAGLAAAATAAARRVRAGQGDLHDVPTPRRAHTTAEPRPSRPPASTQGPSPNSPVAPQPRARLTAAPRVAPAPLRRGQGQAAGVTRPGRR